ncbi:hypothetical protein GE09DRAFT_953930 [Coniochaeta sp. 2T2.1]|nr:hypothetical protein GE09DRAFT_953930 [Coniochaeta sp. 2T2.1]
MWNNFTLWTAQRLGYAVNISKLTPSIEDLVLAGPRMVLKLGRLGGSYISFPDAIDGFGQRIIPESTDAGLFATGAAAMAQTTAATAAAIPAVGAEQDPGAFMTRFSMEGARGIGSVFSYATSKWALCCFGLAIILNRTLIFAAPRRRFALSWPARLAMRLVPIILLVIQARSLLESIQCQTSPDFAELRWGNSSKSSDLLFTQPDSFLHGLSSTLLFGATDEQSCMSVHMIAREDEPTAANLRGSLSRLWPLFGTFCMSNFIETISCVVQGKPVSAETGMTLFEHSLAFSEAEAAISNQLGWGLFSNASVNAPTTAGNNIAITRRMIMRRVNTPPEVLLVAFLSTMGHVVSHLSGIFNMQAKDRLLRTGLNAILFMGSIIWAIFNFSIDDPKAQSLLRYPTVCIIGFIPHLLIFGGMVACFVIYCLALLLVASSTPDIPGEDRPLTFRERLTIAHANMQANAQLSDSIRVRMDMDFYTALLRTGFAAISMASEAVYLNEDRRVNLKRHTWLEDARFGEVEQLVRTQALAGTGADGEYEIGTIGLVPVKAGQSSATSGYAREKAAQRLSKDAKGAAPRVRVGIGAMERNNRWMMAIEYGMHINKLIMTAWAIAITRVLLYMGVRNPPRWLRWLATRPIARGGKKAEQRANPVPPVPRQPDFPGLTPDEEAAANAGRLMIRRDLNIDVEAEVRRWIQTNNRHCEDEDLDGMLYHWFKKGGWWGTVDDSNEYKPPPGWDDPDWDTTSIVTESDSVSQAGDDPSSFNNITINEPQAEGQRTPTQQTFRSTRSTNPFARESTPLVDTPLPAHELAKLLNPSTPEDSELARYLSSHLTTDRALTRSNYRRLQARERARVLLPPRLLHRQTEELDRMTPAEEADTLEKIILSRRHSAAAAVASGGGEGRIEEGSWATGASGMGPDGPQCVVCQSAPRTIIVWPCRCLSLCDDCRVSLAMNNFDKCVCCRREVASFSRIYVP